VAPGEVGDVAPAKGLVAAASSRGRALQLLQRERRPSRLRESLGNCSSGSVLPQPLQRLPVGVILVRIARARWHGWI